ncbi:chorismate synthase [Candidatus Vidania fulgoroideae]|uniref:Chorismate synthase n=1 Tax=Candidatus Vidania fulgoroideorum TaxID=881286 RepID=A0A974XDZ3_9PROT|nr:chorismate synthase [Candidatus Vidania fulgoroideae]
MSNSLGTYFKVTTFGESHGKAIGCIIDGCPSGIEIKKSYIQRFLNKRKPGKSRYVTSRKEKDKVMFLSGVYKDKTTGSPLCLVCYNYNKLSKDYKNIKDVFRPGHADITYFNKYGVRDYRGGGRASARTTISLVIAGSIARKILKDFFNIKIFSYINSVGNKNISFVNKRNIGDNIFSVPNTLNIGDIKKEIREATIKCDSVGSSIKLIITGMLPGIGEPLYKKLDSELTRNLIGINAVKSLSIGNGYHMYRKYGSNSNDQIKSTGFISNNSGGILGGISTGQDILIDIFIKPTPSIYIKQDTICKEYKNRETKIIGRHDPCVGLRAPVIMESISSVVILNLIMKQRLNLFF